MKHKEKKKKITKISLHILSFLFFVVLSQKWRRNLFRNPESWKSASLDKSSFKDFFIKCDLYALHSLREKFPYSTFFWFAFSHIWTEYGITVFSPIAGTYGPGKLRIGTYFTQRFTEEILKTKKWLFYFRTEITAKTFLLEKMSTFCLWIIW